MKLARLMSATLLLTALAFVVAGSVSELLAQGPRTPPATLRAYTHIFIAYAVAWLFLLAWVLRIASKLKQAATGS